MKRDLIEPDWNVNFLITINCFVSFLDLIEPDWNVNNACGLKLLESNFGFNRTRLECKLRYEINADYNLVRDLIEPDWNVNRGYKIYNKKLIVDLIEPDWNVNISSINFVSSCTSLI